MAVIGIVLLVAAVAILAVVADLFVSSSSKLAAHLGVSPLVVGVVIMGFGTSLPELLVSTQAAASGQPILALGNIVGSNVVNLSIVLGAGALIRPLVVHGSVARREAPVAVISTLLYAGSIILGIGGNVFWAVLLLLFGTIAVGSQIIKARADKTDPLITEVELEVAQAAAQPLGRQLAFSAVLLIALIASAQLLLFAAQDVASIVGLSETAAGILLLAVGTSLPELAAVIAAARRSEHELIAGNLWGSTLFNAAFVGGAALAVGTIPTVPAWVVLMPVAVATIAWLVTRHGLKVSRVEGAVLLFGGIVATALLAFA